MGSNSDAPQTNVHLTFQKAVDMGEYNPEYLSTFPEWNSFSRHIKFQYINKAIENRRRQLLQQYADMNNILDYRLKPEVQKAVKNVLKQLDLLDEDREKFLIEYSK